VIVPPLRERADDILMLAEHFLRRFARKHGVKVTGFADSARSAIMAYRWPGNVRELQNTIERAVILSEAGRLVTAASLGMPSYLALNDVPDPQLELPTGEPEPAAPRSGRGEIFRLDELQKQAIQAALRQTGGNRTQAAEALGISIRTLRNKLQEYRDAGDPFAVELGAADS
jgi:DNA-binding NtrC family response regulator